MTNTPSKQINTTRRLDCVTEIRMGNNYVDELWGIEIGQE